MLPTTSNRMPFSRTNDANRGTSGKQGLQQFVAQDDHIAPLRSVQFIEPAPFLEGKITDLVQLRLDAQNFAVRRWRIR